jgi:hypothetical protein
MSLVFEIARLPEGTNAPLKCAERHAALVALMTNLS